MKAFAWLILCLSFGGCTSKRHLTDTRESIRPVDNLTMEIRFSDSSYTEITPLGVYKAHYRMANDSIIEIGHSRYKLTFLSADSFKFSSLDGALKRIFR